MCVCDNDCHLITPPVDICRSRHASVMPLLVNSFETEKQTPTIQVSAASPNGTDYIIYRFRLEDVKTFIRDHFLSIPNCSENNDWINCLHSYYVNDSSGL